MNEYDPSTLSEYEGKKLLWVGADKENGFLYLMFEGGISLSVDPSSIAKCKTADFAAQYLNENKAFAESVIKLSKLMESEVSNDAGPSQGGVEADPQA